MVGGHARGKVMSAARPASSTSSAMASAVQIPKNISSRDLLSKVESIGRFGIWVYDVASGQAHCSSGVHHILGAAALNRPFHPSSITRMAHPRDAGSAVDVFSLSLRGTPSQQTFRIVRADRTVRWIHTLAEPVLGDNGLVASVVGIVTDVTAQEEAARLLALNERRRHGLFDHLAMRTWSVDATGRPIDGAPLAGPAPGRRSSPEEPRPDASFEDALLLDKVRGAIAQGRPFSLCHLVLDERHRRRVPLLLGGAPILDDEGQVLEWHGFTLRMKAGGMPQVNIRHIEPQHVRAARALMKWSVQELARRAGVSVSTVQRLESDTSSRPSDPLVTRIIEALREGGATLCYGPSGNICLLDG